MCHEECTCQEFISQISDCGHILKGKCSDIENMKCDIKVYIFLFKVQLTMNLLIILIFDNCLCSR